MKENKLNPERQRLEQQRAGKEDWRLWGPYLAERAWGSVREDYSPYGSAWEFFDHDQARSRVYRWNEDGLGGSCDEQQRLCLAFALWNGRPILKEPRWTGLLANLVMRRYRKDILTFWKEAATVPELAEGR